MFFFSRSNIYKSLTSIKKYIVCLLVVNILKIIRIVKLTRIPTQTAIWTFWKWTIKNIIIDIL